MQFTRIVGGDDVGQLMFRDWILLGVVFFLEFIHHGNYTVETFGHISPEPVLKEPNAQSAVRWAALITSVFLTLSTFETVRQSKRVMFFLRSLNSGWKVKRKLPRGYAQIPLKAFPLFPAFPFVSWAPTGRWWIDFHSLWACVWGRHILVFAT